MPTMLSIVIPNWNGEEFIARCLAATLQSAQASGYSFEVIVVDDQSHDNSPDIIARGFSRVQLVRNPQNLGFGETVRRGAQLAQGEYLALLNNDLVPKEPMIAELVAPLESNPRLFGVSAKTVNWGDGSPNHVGMSAVWRNGRFELVHSDCAVPEPAMFLQGGSCTVRREEFLRLGGFCPLFKPGYWEDYDLSYLALKAGWQNLYNPKAVAYHLGQASMRRAFEATYLDIMRERNFWLFSWLNLTDSSLLREHLAKLPGQFARDLLAPLGERARAKGLLRALKAVDAVSRERQKRLPLLRRSDREILNEARTQYENTSAAQTSLPQ